MQPILSEIAPILLLAAAVLLCGWLQLRLSRALHRIDELERQLTPERASQCDR